MPKQVLFLTLKIFSSTGGIEKMSRITGKALNEIGEESGSNVKIFSSHDKQKEKNRYFPADIYFVFNSNKLSFSLKSIMEGIKSKTVILSHINLLSVGYLIKLVSPKTKLILFAHGIEVWKPATYFQKKMLSKCNQIFAVSNYTNHKIQELGYVQKNQSSVLNNCLDPYLPGQYEENKSTKLLSRYNLTNKNFVLLTLTRLSFDEKYKGYDKVLECLPDLLNTYPHLRYLIIGKYDDKEKERMNQLIQSLNLTNAVILGGYIPDEEIGLHYNLADIYIMPSKGEGFGIVFIEAMYYNKPVIAGNQDGSVDALLNGQLGILVDPDNKQEIISAIKKVINNPDDYNPDYNLLMNKFSYDVYKKKLKESIEKLYN